MTFNKKGAALAGLIGAGVICAAALAPTAQASGDQDAVSYAAEVNAAATSTSDDVTAAQARNNALLICGMRSGEMSGAKHPQPFTESELIAQYGGDHLATVMVTRGEYHFCPEYGS
jgi:hypothetical protein